MTRVSSLLFLGSSARRLAVVGRRRRRRRRRRASSRVVDARARRLELSASNDFRLLSVFRYVRFDRKLSDDNRMCSSQLVMTRQLSDVCRMGVTIFGSLVCLVANRVCKIGAANFRTSCPSADLSSVTPDALRQRRQRGRQSKRRESKKRCVSTGRDDR